MEIEKLTFLYQVAERVQGNKYIVKQAHIQHQAVKEAYNWFELDDYKAMLELFKLQKKKPDITRLKKKYHRIRAAEGGTPQTIGMAAYIRAYMATKDYGA